jgi:protein-tyrosine phosphatase/ADP-ribosylglycohydrolase
MAPTSDATVPLPIPATYWLVPGRLLVGEYPGSQSRAEAMERLRRFLQAGVTCFVDLTEPRELPSYEALLPFETPEGRRVEYLREPVPDHGVPADRETMQRAIAMIDNALSAGHVVYLHCRAGIGRSATVAGCWLASRAARTSDAFAELQRCWRQSAKSREWEQVPETEEQVAYIHGWTSGTAGPMLKTGGAIDPFERARGALLGLAAGDAFGAAQPPGSSALRSWTQHTSLALCLAESLLDCGGFDARDQIERYLRWQRDGHLSATGKASVVTPDVAKALANYQWRGQAMAGSHDPRDRSTAALPRVVAAVLFSLPDPAAAVRLAGECARTTHQSPFVIDACRYYGAMLVGALRGAAPRAVLEGLYEPTEGFWTGRPLKPAVVAAARATGVPRHDTTSKRGDSPDAMLAIARVRAAVAAAAGFDDAVQRARDRAVEPGLEAALAGTLMGALHGAAVIPRERLAQIARLELIESFAGRLQKVASGVQAK